MPSQPDDSLNVHSTVSHGPLGLPSSTLPLTSDIPTSQWQPTIDIDPDLNVSTYQDFAQQLSDSCAYYCDESLNRKLNEFPHNSFSVLHYNIRGLISSYSEIESFLFSKPLKVVGLCETFLNADNQHLYAFTGYHVIHKPRPGSRRGGGVSLLIDQSLIFSERNDLSTTLTCAESLFIEIPRHMTSLRKKIIIGEIYRPPNSSKTTFINELEILLNRLDHDDAICYLMGDFNIDLMVCDTDSDSIDYINALSRHSFFPLINRPTRLASRTLLDHIFTNSRVCLGGGRFFSGIALTDLSDHFPIVHRCESFHAGPEHQNSTFKFQLINERTISAFKTKLSQIDWSDLLSIDDVNEFYEQFSERLQNTYTECIPTIVKQCKANHKPWITTSLQKSIKEKNRLYATSIRHPCQYSKERYRAYKNRLNHLLRISERNYAHEQFSKYSNNLKNQWKVINSLIERKQQSSLPSAMRFDTAPVTITDPQHIAEEMNSFFINAGSLVIDQNPPSTMDPLSFLPDASQDHTMYARPATEREVLKIIEQLKNSSSGIDQLKPKVIKEVKSIIIKPLTHLINLSLKKGIFPDKLKEAVITPVFKKGSKDLVGNYRPISVLNVFSKILEKVMYSRLLDYLEATEILYDRQFGFRRGCSTEMAVTEAVSIITRALNDKHSILSVNMDLSKAFDTINHDILCRKLSKYGLSGNILNWFVSYLNRRKQVVKYNGIFSSKRVIQCGVPQGSNLGPLLFILYINDLHLICRNSDPILYADDCNLFFRLNRAQFDPTPINDQLKVLSDWFSCNHLALNPKKTNYMVFSGRRRVAVSGIMLNGSELLQVQRCNFLGICIDVTLSWKSHIQATCRKLAKSIGILRKINKKLSQSTMMQLYNSFILPYLQYGITLWGASSNSSLEPLFVMQKKALKLTLNLPIRTSTLSLFQNPKLRHLQDLYTFGVSVFMYKFQSQSLPTCFNEYFSLNSAHHSHNTRSAMLYRLPLFHTVTCQKSILYQGPKVWSSIPDAIRQSCSLNTFKVRMKAHLADLRTSLL